MIRMLGCLTLSQRSLRLSSFLSILFLFSFLLHLFPPFYLIPHLLCLLPPLFYCWFPPECFWSHLLHYSLSIDFFISSRSLLNIFCIFWILVSSLFICNSILFSRFWIIFTIIIQNHFQVDSLSPPLWFGLVGFYHASSPAEYFSAFSFCLDCCVWGALSVGWNFVALLLWSLLSVGGVGLVACQGFLLRKACVGVLVGGAGFLLPVVHWSIR